MKKVAYSIVILSLFFTAIACKSDKDKSSEETQNNDLAVSETVEKQPEYLYVTAPSGLTLREHNNLNSEKLAVMPYGTKVKIISPEENETMTVGGIKGGMHEVEFNQKTGYAFNGYLSKYFPPEDDMKAEFYVEDLQKFFPKVTYAEETGGTASAPFKIETVTLPNAKWHEAFYLASELFEIPKSFAFPNPKGSNEEVVKEEKPKSGTWKSYLTVNRDDNSLQKITYTHATEGFGYSVTITEENGAMQLKREEGSH